MSLTDTLAGIVGAAHVITDPDVLDGRSVDHTGRYRGHASALVRPGSDEEVAAVLRACREAGAFVTVQGGRTSLVAGTVPEHDDVLLSTERLREIGEVDVGRAAHPRRGRRDAGRGAARRISRGSGVRRRSGRTRFGDRRAGWRRRTRAACARCATATWASRSSAWMWRCPTGRWCTDIARFGATTPDTTWRRCSSAPRARWASSRGWICGCTQRRHTGSPRSAGSTTSTRWSKPAVRSGTWTASRRWS